MTDVWSLLREATRLSSEAARIRDRALDAHLSGDRPAAKALLEESRLLVEHALSLHREARAILKAERR